jgi:hypothetical protein
MSPHLISEIVNKHAMFKTCIQGYKTQAEADAIYRELIASDEIVEEFVVRQFASGWYFVVLVPRILG